MRPVIARRIPSPEPTGRLLLAAVLMALALIVALTVWIARLSVPPPVPADWTTFFPAADVDADAGYRRGLWLLALVAIPIGPAVAVAIALTGRRWRGALLRATRGRIVLAGALIGAGLGLASALAHLPIGLAALGWRRRHDVSRQPLGDWFVDAALAGLIQSLVLAIVGLVLAVALVRLARAWPAVLVAITAITVLAGGALSPLVIEPLFERTTPLADPGLAADARALAERAGVDVGEVVVSDASRRTRTINARVSGIGASRRIVLYDTLVAGLPRDQARVVIAHELAHVQHRHILVGSAWAMAFSVPAALAIYALVGHRTGFGRAGRDHAGREVVLRRLTLVLALVALALALSAPLANRVSRALEAQADWTALRLSDDPTAAIALQRELVRLRRGDPDPPAALHAWFGTHPPPIERVGLALRHRHREGR